MSFWFNLCNVRAYDMSSIDKCRPNVLSNKPVDWLRNSFCIFFSCAWSISRPMDNFIGCFLNKNTHLLSPWRDADFFNTAIPVNCLGVVASSLSKFWILLHLLFLRYLSSVFFFLARKILVTFAIFANFRTFRGSSWLLLFLYLEFCYICYFCAVLFCDICPGCF